MQRDALPTHGGGRHRAVQQIVRFRIFRKERIPTPSLVAAFACSEAAFPEPSKRTVSVGRRLKIGAVVQSIT